MTLDELQTFCSTDPGRANLAVPWTRGDYTWATNGKILVRVPAIDGVENCPAAPDAALIFEKNGRDCEWQSVPTVAMPLDDCHSCDGSGFHECSCGDGNSHPCGYCNGTGKRLDREVQTAIGDARFAHCYLALIPGWEISPGGHKDAAWIRKGDALGLLMPMWAWEK